MMTMKAAYHLLYSLQTIVCGTLQSLTAWCNKLALLSATAMRGVYAQAVNMIIAAEIVKNGNKAQVYQAHAFCPPEYDIKY